MQVNIITADSRAASLKVCDPDDFPDLYVFLKITATLSETTCEWKCLISCTMGKSRLSSFAPTHIKYDEPVGFGRD